MCIDLSATVVENETDDYDLDIVSGGIQSTIGSVSEHVAVVVVYLVSMRESEC